MSAPNTPLAAKHSVWPDASSPLSSSLDAVLSPSPLDTPTAHTTERRPLRYCQNYMAAGIMAVALVPGATSGRLEPAVLLVAEHRKKQSDQGCGASSRLPIYLEILML